MSLKHISSIQFIKETGRRHDLEKAHGFLKWVDPVSEKCVYATYWTFDSESAGNCISFNFLQDFREVLDKELFSRFYCEVSTKFYSMFDRLGFGVRDCTGMYFTKEKRRYSGKTFDPAFDLTRFKRTPKKKKVIAQ